MTIKDVLRICLKLFLRIRNTGETLPITHLALVNKYSNSNDATTAPRGDLLKEQSNFLFTGCFAGRGGSPHQQE